MNVVPVDSIPSRDAPERRGSPRCRILKGGALSFNKGYGAMECLVRNLSEGGAMLAFGDGLGVPPIFDLRVAGDAARRQARVRWRDGARVGVSFD